MVFPAILLLYVFLLEQQGTLLAAEGAAPAPQLQRLKWKAAFRAIVPALLVTAAFALLQSAMTPANFAPGAPSGFLYRITQPYVALHYFKSFFLPTELSADSDWSYVRGPFSTDAVVGYLFVAALLCGRRLGRPAAAIPAPSHSACCGSSWRCCPLR